MLRPLPPPASIFLPRTRLRTVSATTLPVSGLVASATASFCSWAGSRPGPAPPPAGCCPGNALLNLGRQHQGLAKLADVGHALLVEVGDLGLRPAVLFSETPLVVGVVDGRGRRPLDVLNQVADERLFGVQVHNLALQLDRVVGLQDRVDVLDGGVLAVIVPAVLVPILIQPPATEFAKVVGAVPLSTVPSIARSLAARVILPLLLWMPLAASTVTL